MNLELSWDNVNVIPTTVKIYRDIVPIDRANLGTPIAIITDGSEKWIDTTAVRGTKYHYVFESTSAKDRVVSNNIEIYAVPRTGPGPQTLIAGDMEAGYFGDLTAGELFSSYDIIDQLQLPAWPVYTAYPSWAKLAYKGKVLFVPYNRLFSGGAISNWKSLYDMGLVYGVDGPGPGHYQGTPVNQLRKMTKGREEFIVRLPTGGGEGNGLITLPTTLTPLMQQTVGSEWDDLIYPLCQWVPSTQRTVNWSNKTRDAFNSFYSTVCQELMSDDKTKFLTRGSSVYTTKDGLTFVNRYALTATDSSLCWRPVFELVPGFKVNPSV